MTWATWRGKKPWGFLGQFCLWWWECGDKRRLLDLLHPHFPPPPPKGCLSTHSISKSLELQFTLAFIFVCGPDIVISWWQWTDCSDTFPFQVHTTHVRKKSLQFKDFSLGSILIKEKILRVVYHQKFQLVRIKNSRTSSLSPAEASAIQNT